MTATSNKTNADNQDNPFSKHTDQDVALRPASSKNNNTDGGTTASPPKSTGRLTVPGRILVFLVFPLGVGLLGLYLSHLENRRQPDKELSLDRDFILPFLLALAMVIVIGFQTGGFARTTVEPIVPWPKVKRVQKVVHRTVPRAAKTAPKED